MRLTNLHLASLILAAGESRRFGDCKLTAELNRQSLLEHQLLLAQQITPSQVNVVVGAYVRDLKSLINDKASVFENCDWRQGIGSSIAFGIEKLRHYDGVLILLGDQIALTRHDLMMLKDCWADNPNHIVCATYANTFGVPAIFPHHLYEELVALTGDHGAKSVIHKNRAMTKHIAMENACVDIDTTEDLIKFEATYLIRVHSKHGGI